MILGMSTSLFTSIHVVLSLIGILSGLIVLGGMLASKRLQGWSGVFLWTTVLTSATGFLFHSKSFGPPHVVGLISLIILVLSIVALYGHHLAKSWRWIYVVTALMALYLNCFVAVVQAFQKFSFLHSLAPTGSEPPFAIAQGLVLVLFIVLGIIAGRRFHPEPSITLAARIST